MRSTEPKEVKEICPRRIVVETPTNYDLIIVAKDIGVVIVKNKESLELAKIFWEHVLRMLEEKYKVVKEKVVKQ